MRIKTQLIDLNRLDFLEKIPSLPGVYQFVDKKQNVVYVGKSVNLRSRISSYFSTAALPKTKKMVSTSKYIGFIVTNNEFEALILEAELIKREKPKYNVIQKDDKSPIYIKITKETYPRILLCRKTDMKRDKKSSYFGPYLSTRDAKKLTRTIRKFVPFADHRPDKSECFYSQIGLCNPCPSLIEKTKDEEERKRLKRIYFNNIRKVKNILEGKILFVYKKLKRELDILIEQEKFEEAKEMTKKISFLENLTQKVNRPYEYLENPNLAEDIRENEVKKLKEFLSNFYHIKKLTRIECFDVSHTSGKNVVGSMVVFINGEKETSLYRRFKISNSKNDDPASLREVIQRRVKHFDDWGIPDLMILDGGKPQILAVFDIARIIKVPIVGLAKKDEKLIIPILEGERIRFLRREIVKESFGNLLIRIRDESHRFAKKYHRLLQDRI